MRALTYEMGMHIADLGQKLAQAVTSAEKVKIAAEINRYASEEMGGETIKSDDIHEIMESAKWRHASMKLWPSTSQQQHDTRHCTTKCLHPNFFSTLSRKEHWK